MKLELKFDPIRQFYLRFNQAELNERDVPQVLINVIKRKDQIECLTLDLAKRNQKVGSTYCTVSTTSTNLLRSSTLTMSVCCSVGIMKYYVQTTTDTNQVMLRYRNL